MCKESMLLVDICFVFSLICSLIHNICYAFKMQKASKAQINTRESTHAEERERRGREIEMIDHQKRHRWKARRSISIKIANSMKNHNNWVHRITFGRVCRVYLIEWAMFEQHSKRLRHKSRAIESCAAAAAAIKTITKPVKIYEWAFVSVICLLRSV